MRNKNITRRKFLKSVGYLAGTGIACRSGFAISETTGSQHGTRAEALAEELETMSRERLIEYIVYEIKRGLDSQDLVSALTLAAVRNLQPYPDVGFKFHGVMMLQSLQLAAQSLPAADRWLPMLWGVDEFKRSQQREQGQTGWRMRFPHVDKLDPARAKADLLAALENWDLQAADTAVSQLTRATSPMYAMSVLSPYHARDYRALGHKPITGANTHRMLLITGSHRGEAVIRSTTAAILNHAGESNPVQNDFPADSAWRQNLTLMAGIPRDWQRGRTDPGGITAMLSTLRSATDLEASRETVRLLAGGIGPQVIWESLLAAAGEMMLRTGSFFALHANTMINALHYLYLHADDEEAGKLLLLQSTALLARFRNDIGYVRRDMNLEDLEPLETSRPEEIFAAMGDDRLRAARLALGYLLAGFDSKPLLDQIRHYTVDRTGNVHDYKYAEAVIENYQNMSSPWRNLYLSSAMVALNGPHNRKNYLIRQARELLAA